MGREQNSSARIMDAAIRAVREMGLENLTTRRIAQLAETSPGNMYTFFSGKEELLEQCFYKVDKEIAALFTRVALPSDMIRNDPIGGVRKLWYIYFDYLMKNPDKTIFYYRFRTSASFPEFQRRRDESYFVPFLRLAEQLGRRSLVSGRINADVLWIYVLNTTLMYAKYIIEGVLPDTPATAESIFALLLGGLRQFLPE
ncbi:MAG: TetR/AcrR family transcriptional regulator [Clostridiaceae bacterium]|nr:TetR/AcrR family transcriptional regulator [Clostridiaceae bacterium]